jgi:fucose permease
MLPIYAGDICGLKSYDDVLGIFVSIAYVGMAVAPPVMNLFYDLLGNYTLGLISFLILYVIITIVFIVSKNLSKKHKKQLERM